MVKENEAILHSRQLIGSAPAELAYCIMISLIRNNAGVHEIESFSGISVLENNFFATLTELIFATSTNAHTWHSG
jgi:hypothetical protein